MSDKRSAFSIGNREGIFPLRALLGAWSCLLLLLLAPAPGNAQQTLQRLPQELKVKAASPLHQLVTPAHPKAYRVQVKSLPEFQQWLARHLPQARLSGPAYESQILTIEKVEAHQLPKLLASPWVLFVDVANRKAQPELNLNHADLSVNHIRALHRYFPALNGQGFMASVKEDPFDTTDIDLRGRILLNAFFQKPPTLHATTIATLIGGAGNSGPQGRGVAFRARLTSSSYAEFLPDNSQALLTAGVTVQNHSYGVAGMVENYYGLEALAYDQQTFRHPQLLHVFSSGNAGTEAGSTGPYAGLQGWANLTGQFKTSKNTLSVGASGRNRQVEALSSRGPTADGRIKPELVAFGENGTSEAAALVSGTALLAQQAYSQQHNQLIPPASLVKAALINSADDMGRPGPDFEAGYGQCDALGTIQTLQEGRFFTGSVSQGASRSFPLQIPAGTRFLKITLVWHDPEARAEADPVLVNDLDLSLQQVETGQSWLPWVLNAWPHPDSLRQVAIRRPDHRNNVEQITLQEPQPGSYTLQVRGYQVAQGPQDFSIAYELESGLSWSYPSRQDQLLPGKSQPLRWRGPVSDTTATGSLEYRLGTGQPWQQLSQQVELHTGSFRWHTPDTTVLAQLRLITSTQTITSEPFLIAPPLLPKVALNCAEELLISWPAVPAATQYQVYRLGKLYLEPLTITRDTLYLVAKPSGHYAFAPIVQGITGQQSISIQVGQQEELCYVENFISRQPVTNDTVIFDALLSTTYGLKSMEWQRLEQGTFRTIQTIAPVAATRFALQDLQAHPGRNDYRLLLTTTDGRQVLSETEEVFYTPADFVLIYPNPLTAGQALQVVLDNDQPTELILYDSIGRVVTRVREIGAIKTLSTTGLKPGIFFLRAQTANGRYLTKRLLVL